MSFYYEQQIKRDKVGSAKDTVPTSTACVKQSCFSPASSPVSLLYSNCSEFGSCPRDYTLGTGTPTRCSGDWGGHSKKPGSAHQLIALAIGLAQPQTTTTRQTRQGFAQTRLHNTGAHHLVAPAIELAQLRQSPSVFHTGCDARCDSDALWCETRQASIRLR